MTAAVVATAADSLPPLSGNVLAATSGVASAVLDISALEGRFVTIQNSGANAIFYQMGDANSVADDTATSGADACMAIAAGDQRDFRYVSGLTFTDGSGVKRLVTHIAFISPAGASTLRVAQS